MNWKCVRCCREIDESVDDFLEAGCICVACRGMNKITIAKWDQMTADEQFEYVRLVETLLSNRDELLKAIPECPEHGECIPHALEWIAQQQTGGGDKGE